MTLSCFRCNLLKGCISRNLILTHSLTQTLSSLHGRLDRPDIIDKRTKKENRKRGKREKGKAEKRERGKEQNGKEKKGKRAKGKRVKLKKGKG